jgi:hypothetical protein
MCLCIYRMNYDYCGKVYISQSNIHGRGVFAQCDIPENSIVTFYPRHAIRNGDVITINHGLTDDYNTYIESNTFDDYEMLLQKNESIIGFPTIVNDMKFVGHMLNDPIGNIFCSPKRSVILKCISEYNQRIVSDSNCACQTNYETNHTYIVTRKNIKKNDELLLPYGAKYWLMRFRRNCEYVFGDVIF